MNETTGNTTTPCSPSPAAERTLAAAIANSARSLPRSVRELAEEIGPEATVRLVATRGGTTVHVPKRGSEKRLVQHRLAAELGRSALEALVNARGGEKLQVPSCAAVFRDQRRRQAREQVDSGVTVGSIARDFACSERSIRRLLAPVPSER